MTTPWRLPQHNDEWIDRLQLVKFLFEGREYVAYAGDTITSALAANGVRLLGRSFKYHRPRGMYSLAGHDVNAMMSDGRSTNIRADVTPVWAGAELKAVNTFGGLVKDRFSFIDRFSRFLPVGFYYKTFHHPRSMFPFWERRMRAMAGLGAIDPRAKRIRTPKAYAWCDVLVVGAGPTGLAAAVAAAEQGLKVVLVDEQRRIGGSLLYQWQGAGHPPKELDEWAARVKSLPNIDIRNSTLAAGYYADHWLALIDERRLTKLRSKAVVLATGAVEQPALMQNNDLPGVMLATAAQRLIHNFAVRPFDRGVVLTANDDGYLAALDIHQAGVTVAAIIDLRGAGPSTALIERVHRAKIVLHQGATVYEALRATSKTGIRGVQIRTLDAHGQLTQPNDTRSPVPGPRSPLLNCDGLAMSVGWAPADSLFCQARGKLRYNAQLEQFVPSTSSPGVFAAGRLNGVYDLADRLADGTRAGLEAAASLGKGVRAASSVPRCAKPQSHPYPIFPHPSGKVFVDLDEDVQFKDLEHAVEEGFDSVELLKRYSTFGMGPSQGKIANTNTIRVLARLRGQSMDEVGAPTARPFYHPVPLCHLAGRGFHPRRRTALHARHDAAGAQWMPAGDWLRPAYYRLPRPLAAGDAGEVRAQAIQEEVEAVHERVGIIDVGTLGKLEISGPDAAEFIERIYTGRFANMKVGTTRYGLMCDESGVIIDDGIVARLAPDRFYLTTTTTASGAVYRELQRWATIWGSRVVLANVTGHLSAMNVAGPLARAILQGLSNLDLAEQNLPYLGLRHGTVAGVPARLIRTGFVGEVGYEIHLPSQYAGGVWDAIMQRGRPHEIRPFGVEAQRVLRLEKGHVIVGQDTDGLTTPLEAGMTWAVKMDKPFFVGQRSLAIVRGKVLTRKLVGFTLPAAFAGPMPQECHLVIEKSNITGRVTSIARSPALKRVIGLAYVHPNQASPGTVLDIRSTGGAIVRGTVVETPFCDPKNLRQKI